jgi:hypothetical protein
LHLDAVLEKDARAAHADIAVAKDDGARAHDAARTLPAETRDDESGRSPITSATT